MFACQQLRKQNGDDYTRSAYLAMMMGVLRFINSSYQEHRIKNDPTTPTDLKLESDTCAGLKHNMDAMCRLLHQKGKGVVQQPFKPEEFQKIITYISSLPESGYKHILTGYLSLAFQFGGRISDYPKFARRYDLQQAYCRICYSRSCCSLGRPKRLCLVFRLSLYVLSCSHVAQLQD